MNSDLALAEHAVRLAASTADSFARQSLRHRRKSGPHDLVSAADEAAEAAVRDLLTSERPDDGLLGEEGTLKTGKRRWVIDAIDGTMNFLRSDPFWCSAVALEDQHGPLVAAVHHLASGETFSAARGYGAHAGGVQLQVSGTRLADGVLATYWNEEDKNDPVMTRAMAAVATTRIRGSGTLELAWLAAGRLDLWLQRTPAPWDWLPGALLVRESGGEAEVVSVAGQQWHVACPANNWRHALRIVEGDEPRPLVLR